MRSRLLFALFGVASCQIVFRLEDDPAVPPCVPIGVDGDTDGIDDACDVCIDVADADQRDVDRDGIGDACDNCPGLASDDLADADNDGIGDVCDNCALTFNVDQMDVDGDKLGDSCDPCPTSAILHDEDADGIHDGCDNCPQSSNANQANVDNDGLGDVCDNQNAPGQIDCIALFDPLTTLDNWDLTTARGTWEVDGDSIVQRDNTQIHGYLASKASFIDPLVATLGRVISIGSNSSQNVGLWVRTTPNPTQPVDIGLVAEAFDVQDGAGAHLSAASCDANGLCTNFEAFPTTDPPKPLGVGATAIIGQDLRLAPLMGYSIFVDGGARSGSTTNLPNDVSARVGLRTNSAETRFDFFLVVVRNATPCPP